MKAQKEIGKSDTSGLLAVEDIYNLKVFYQFLFGKRKGHRCIGQKVGDDFSQRFFPANRAGDELNMFDDEDNIFIAIHRMRSKRRGVDNLEGLDLLYIDLDCYNVGLTPEQALEKLKKEYEGTKIPSPSMAICSGKGLHIVWKICEHANALPRWNRVQKFLCKVLRPLGADPCAIDASRFLRVPYTWNSKNGRRVRILAFQDIKYTLHEIIKAYDIKEYDSISLSETRKRGKKAIPATEKQRVLATEILVRQGKPLPNFDDIGETSQCIAEAIREDRSRQHIASATKSSAQRTDGGTLSRKFTQVTNLRLADLEILVTQLRTGIDCGREMILFLARLWMGELTGDFDLAKKYCLELNRKFKHPLSDNEAEKATASAEKKLRKGRTYKYSDKKLMLKLGITEKEEAYLSYFTWKRISADKKDWRKAQKNAAYRKKREKEGKIPKKEEIEEKKKTLVDLLEQGLSCAAICAHLGIGRSTFYSFKKEIKERLNEIKKENAAGAAVTAEVNGLEENIVKIVEENLPVDTGIQDTNVKGKPFWKQCGHLTVLSRIALPNFPSHDDGRKASFIAMQKRWREAPPIAVQFFRHTIKRNPEGGSVSRVFRTSTDYAISNDSEITMDQCGCESLSCRNMSSHVCVEYGSIQDRSTAPSPCVSVTNCAVRVHNPPGGGWDSSTRTWDFNLSPGVWRELSGKSQRLPNPLGSEGRFKLPDSVSAGITQPSRDAGIDGGIVVRWCWLPQRARDGPLRGTAA